MRIIQLLLILSISLFSCSSKVKKPQIEKEKKKILFSEETHTYKERNGKIENEIIETKIYSDGQITSVKTENTYEYINSKNLIIIKSFDIIDNDRELTLTTYKHPSYIEKVQLGFKSDTTIYIKDFYENGLIVKSINNVSFVTGDKIQEISINQYNNNRQIIKTEIFDLNNKFLSSHTYTYSKSGNIVEIINKNDKGEVAQKTTQTLRNDTIVLEVLEIPNVSTDSVFYTNSLVTKEISTRLSPENKTIIENKYDQNGRLIEQKNYILK